MRSRALTPVVVALLSASWLGLFAMSAQAAETTLRWSHPDPDDVSGFTVHLGYSRSGYEPELTQTFAGLSPDASGVYEVTIDIESDRLVFVAVRAFNDQVTSDYSNEQKRYSAASLGVPGRPHLVGF